MPMLTLMSMMLMIGVGAEFLMLNVDGCVDFEYDFRVDADTYAHVAVDVDVADHVDCLRLC